MVKTACPGEKWAKRGLMRRCHASGHVMTLGLQISKCGKRGWKVKVKVAQLCLTLQPHGRNSPWKTSCRKGCLSRDQKPWRCGRGGLRDEGDPEKPPRRRPCTVVGRPGSQKGEAARNGWDREGLSRNQLREVTEGGMPMHPA